MKYLIIPFFFISCSQPIILPKVNINSFSYSKKYKLRVYIEKHSDNKEFMIIEKNRAFKFIKHTKQLRSNYNLLLYKIRNFNTRIKNEQIRLNNKSSREIKFRE